MHGHKELAIVQPSRKIIFANMLLEWGIRLKQCKPPPAARNVSIGEKRKRGRPQKTKGPLTKAKLTN